MDLNAEKETFSLQKGSTVIRYDFDGYPASLSREIEHTQRTAPSLPHWHEEFEFLYIVSGKLTMHIDKSTIPLLPTQGLFINRRQPHYPPPQKICSIEEDCQVFSLLFHPSVLKSCGSLFSRYADAILENSALPFFHIVQTVPWQKELLSLLLKMEQSWSSPTAALHIQGLLCQVWESMYIHLCSEAAETDPASPTSALKAMVAFIHRSYAEKIFLKDIADVGFVSKNTAINLFHRHMGTSPIHYLNNYRLEAATHLLATTNLPVTEIALSTGFSSPSYFVKLFRQAYGLNPSTYRRKQLF